MGKRHNSRHMELKKTNKVLLALVYLSILSSNIHGIIVYTFSDAVNSGRGGRGALRCLARLLVSSCNCCHSKG